jgi:pseudouridine synthase
MAHKRAKNNKKTTDPKGAERLQKVLSRAGVASRRGAEELILAGRVSVDGEIADALPCFVDADAQDIRVDGERIAPERKEYIVLNKPRGYVCTLSAAEGSRAVDLAPPGSPRLHTVGRLDADSEGLIFLTNDGEFTNIVTHPRYGLPKTYDVTVQGMVKDEVLAMLLKGVHLAEGKAACSAARKLKSYSGRTILRLTLKEGRNREIRRILAKCGLKTKRLRRIAIGEVRLGRLRTGRTRPLTAREIQLLTRGKSS